METTFLHHNHAKMFDKHEKGYFNEHLECPAPKHWTKYTTVVKQLL